MTLSNKISKLIYTYTKYYNSNLVKEIQKEADNYTIEFYNWMRKEDIPENADKYFHCTDKDMLNYFKEEIK